MSDEKEDGLKRKTEIEGDDVKLKTVGAYARYLGLLVFFILAGVTNMNAFGLLGFGNTASWKEEVLLHDGSKIIVKRWQKRGGRHIPGEKPDISEQSISFAIPGSKRILSFKDEYSPELGRCNFRLLALHIINTNPFLIMGPRLNLSYNKWGRPNPPYVIFKFVGKDWKRIALSELPIELEDVNMVISTLNNEEELVHQGVVSAEMVKKFNSSLTQEEYKTILRTPLKNMHEPIMVPTEDGGWLGIDWFTDQPNYEACINFCKRKKVKTGHCPCDAIFKGGKQRW